MSMEHIVWRYKISLHLKHANYGSLSCQNYVDNATLFHAYYMARMFIITVIFPDNQNHKNVYAETLLCNHTSDARSLFFIIELDYF